MLSLKEQALLAAVQEKTTLKELIAFCSSSQFKDVCYFSKKFWLEMLPKVGRKKLALLFEPLKDEYWQFLIEGIADGVSFRKLFELNTDFFEPVDIENPPEVIVASPLVAEEIFNDYDNANIFFNLLIDGIRLPSGTLGWIIDFLYYDNRNRNSVNNFMLASKDQNDEERIIDFITEEYYDKLRYNMPFSDYVVTRNNFLEDVSYLSKFKLWEFKNIDGINSLMLKSRELPDKKLIRNMISNSYTQQDHRNWFECSLLLFHSPNYEHETDGRLFSKSTEFNFSIYKSRLY